jgi:hypothetical protein
MAFLPEMPLGEHVVEDYATLTTRADAANQPVTRSGGVGAECDSVFARLFECHAADGKGLRFRGARSSQPRQFALTSALSVEC